MKLFFTVASLVGLSGSVSAFVAPSSSAAAKTLSRNGATSSSSALAANLWDEDENESPVPSASASSKEMSTALPFAKRPKMLDGSLPGDVGFE